MHDAHMHPPGTRLTRPLTIHALSSVRLHPHGHKTRIPTKLCGLPGSEVKPSKRACAVRLERREIF